MTLYAAHLNTAFLCAEPEVPTCTAHTGAHIDLRAHCLRTRDGRHCRGRSSLRHLVRVELMSRHRRTTVLFAMLLPERYLSVERHARVHPVVPAQDIDVCRREEESRRLVEVPREEGNEDRQWQHEPVDRRAEDVRIVAVDLTVGRVGRDRRVDSLRFMNVSIGSYCRECQHIPATGR